MDLELGYITKGLTERSILSQSGGAETLEDIALEDFPLNQINDFSQETHKGEKSHYDEKKVIPVKGVCAAYHGGPLDYPKAVSKAIGDITGKWQVCFEKVQVDLEPARRNPEEDMEEDSSNLGMLTKCKKYYKCISHYTCVLTSCIIISQYELAILFQT